MSKAVFIAGASGAVGRRLAPLLVSEGWRVICTARSADKARLCAASASNRRTRLDGRLEVAGMTVRDRQVWGDIFGAVAGSCQGPESLHFASDKRN
jgi:NADP-dependent 3-hydroxy acid dehydrogenase YdfG